MECIFCFIYKLYFVQSPKVGCSDGSQLFHLIYATPLANWLIFVFKINLESVEGNAIFNFLKIWLLIAKLPLCVSLALSYSRNLWNGKMPGLSWSSPFFLSLQVPGNWHDAEFLGHLLNRRSGRGWSWGASLAAAVHLQGPWRHQAASAAGRTDGLQGHICDSRHPLPWQPLGWCA